MLNRSATALVAAAALLTAGCAKDAADVSARYVPAARYVAMDCERIGEELNRVAAEVNRVTGEQDAAAQRDAVAMGVGLVLFRPALFLLAAGDDEEELARLKGEYEALDRARAEKSCAV